MSKTFSQGFEYDDLDDPVDLVLMTDRTLDEAIERAEEKADNDELTADELVKSMQEAGDLPYDVEDEMGDCEDCEESDDEVDIVSMDADVYRECYYEDGLEDDEEDEIIDTVIDASGDDEEYNDEDDDF